MSELLDVKRVPDYSFLIFKRAKKEEQEQFVVACKDVMNCAIDTVKNFCLLGVKLKALRGSRGFCCVLNENGEYYNFDEFSLFCERAFGFSKTRTSNFLSLADFVELKDGEVVFKKKEYENYNLSQLVELSSVYHKELFAPSMTVKEMRLVKRLLNTAYSSGWTPESALAEAKKRFEPQPTEKVVQATIEIKEEEAEVVNSDVGITAPTEKEELDEAENLPMETVTEEKVPVTGFRGEYLAEFAKRIEKCGIKASVYALGRRADFSALELAEVMQDRFLFSQLACRTSLKNLIQERIEDFFNAFDYTITLNDRAQSIRGAAGSLAGRLCDDLEKALKSGGVK